MKKSYGKVRRYRTAFGHTAGFWVRRVGLLAAAGLLLFLLGWVIGLVRREKRHRFLQRAGFALR